MDARPAHEHKHKHEREHEHEHDQSMSMRASRVPHTHARCNTRDKIPRLVSDEAQQAPRLSDLSVSPSLSSLVLHSYSEREREREGRRCKWYAA